MGAGGGHRTVGGGRNLADKGTRPDVRGGTGKERTRGRGRETMETGDELMRDDEGVRRESSSVE